MELQRMLEGHDGCVNTVAFDPSGSLLVSGSDDQSIKVWDWERGELAGGMAPRRARAGWRRGGLAPPASLLSR